MQKLKVLYNSVCPVCREGICAFERRTRQDGDKVAYVDVSRTPDAFRDMGVSLDDVRFKLHAITPEGELLRGWPAIARLWRVTPGFGWLAIVGDAPGVNLISAGLCDVTARLLLVWNRLNKRW